MLKINRKRIEIILFAVIAGATMFSLKAENQIQKDEITQQTTATPVSGKVVILDARTWTEKMVELVQMMERQNHR